MEDMSVERLVAFSIRSGSHGNRSKPERHERHSLFSTANTPNSPPKKHKKLSSETEADISSQEDGPNCPSHYS